MKICFDANVIVDLFAHANNLADAAFSYDVAIVRGFKTYVPASALADIAYILHRRGLDAQRVDEALTALFELFDCIDVNDADGLRAHRNSMHDFEDSIIAESCARNGIDLIITRNMKDFKLSPVAAMTPADFVRAYKPANYHYAEVEF